MNAAPLDCDLLIHGGVVLTVDPENRIVPDGAVAVTDGRIVAVGRSEELRLRYAAGETLDAEGGVVHPGFIDAHIHVSQYTARSVLPRMAGTAVTMGDWKAALTPEDEHASASLAAIDYLRSGYTGFVDPGTIFEPDAVAPVADEVGIRIWMTDPYVADLAQMLSSHEPDLVSPGFLARWPRDTDEALGRLGGQLWRNASSASLVRGFIGLYGAETATAPLYAAALDIARRNGVQFQEHRGYNPKAYLEAEATQPLSTIERLERDGVLGRGTTFTHMNVVHAPDVARLATSGSAVIWCPYAQLRAMSGGLAEPRMMELHRSGATVGLATDIPRTLNFDAVGSVACANATACGASPTGTEILRMRTIGAARSIGADQEVGSLEIGKCADIVVRPASAPESLQADPAWEAAILGLTRAPALTLINGVPVLRDGEPLNADPADAGRLARRSVRRLMNSIGLTH